MKKAKNKHWIEDAIEKAGSLRADAKRHGESTEKFAAEHEDSPGLLGKRARLAETLMKLRKK